MDRKVDIKKSSGYFVISIDGKIKKINVKDMKDNSTLLLSIIDEKVPPMKEISLPDNSLNIVLIDKHINIFFKPKSITSDVEFREIEKYIPKIKILNKDIDEDALNFLDIYVPDDRKTCGTYSFDLFKFSKNYTVNTKDFKHLLNTFTELFINYILKKIELITKDWVICCVPSHDECNQINNTMSILIKTVINKNLCLNLYDGSNVLYRKFPIEKSAFVPGKRSFIKQYNSLSIRDLDMINDKMVLLIDDIYTSGSSICACKQLLIENGAKKVVLFTFGKTR